MVMSMLILFATSQLSGADAAEASLLSETLLDNNQKLEINIMPNEPLQANFHDTPNNEALANSSTSTAPSLECGIWLAPSVIKGAGLGMYAGKDFEKGSLLQTVGDLCIPIVDIVQHNGNKKFTFLWDEYTWAAYALNADHEGFHEINGASPGFGSAANSFLPVVNVDELDPRRDWAGLHRSKDPGAGAFSPYYDRGSRAVRDITAGEEFYVSYGENWFKTRGHLGPIPLTKDLDKATILFKSFSNLKRRLSQSVSNMSIFEDLWETFIRKSEYTDSRVLGGFHHDNREEMVLLEDIKSVKQLRINQSIRSQEWLQQFGTCGDHIYANSSSISQAGHGAFASRALPTGTIVAQLPLIHITNRSHLNMYHFSKEHPEQPSEEAGERPPQLLLNYCYGHNESTLLLCPYGPIVNFINHNQTRANVKIKWADPARGNFMPQLLSTSLNALEADATAKLAFELVAIRSIEAGEEIFLDYQDEWEAAWQQHVGNWIPVDGADKYKRADDLNQELLEGSEANLFSEFEILRGAAPKHPSNVNLTCNNYFSDDLWLRDYEKGKLNESMKEYDSSAEHWYCHILRTRKYPETGDLLYTVEAVNDADTQSYIWEGPREMFQYYDKPYTSDFFLENAFRHHIGIPDNIFPDAWRNLSPDFENSEYEEDDDDEYEEDIEEYEEDIEEEE